MKFNVNIIDTIDSSIERENLETFVKRDDVQKTMIKQDDVQKTSTNDVQRTLRIKNDSQFLIKLKKTEFDNNVNRCCRDEYQISKKYICDCINYDFRFRFISCSICDRIRMFESE
jgi:hypothetical protein